MPPWVMDFGPPTSPFAMGGGGGGESTAATSSATELGPATAATNPTGSPRCPETVMRQIRWPSTEAGQELQRPCPAHAHSGNPNDPYPAVLVCLARGEWAPRVQAARCQSNWLRNLTARVEAGDSPLAILGELVHRTRPANGIGIGATSGGQLATSSLLHNAAMASSQPAVMFGDDIKQIGHIVRQLVEEMGELIQRISDDKQRHGFAKEMVQVSVCAFLLYPFSATFLPTALCAMPCALCTVHPHAVCCLLRLLSIWSLHRSTCRRRPGFVAHFRRGESMGVKREGGVIKWFRWIFSCLRPYDVMWSL